MNHLLLKKLINKIRGEKIFVTPNNMKVFEGLTEYELNKILFLNPKQFQEFIKPILSLSEKINVSVYKEKLQTITRLLINNKENPNYKHLIELLTNTSIINSNQVVEFSRLFLTITDKYKLKTIKQVILSNKSIDLINFLETVMLCDNHFKIDVLKKIFIKKDIIYPYIFNDLISLSLNSSKDLLDCLNDCLNCNNLLKNSQVMTYLNYLKKCDSVSKLWVVSSIIRDNYMLNSSCLKKVLNTIINLKNEFYLPYIDYLTNKKRYMSDNLFDKLLTTIFKFTKSYQIDAILSLINNEEIMNDYYKLDLLTEYIRKASKNQTYYILKLAKQTEYLDSLYIRYILDMLVTSDSSTKLSSIVDLVKYIINSKKFFRIIEIMNNIENNLAFIYLKELIEFRPSLVDENLELINSFVNLEFSFQIKFILYIIKNNRLSDSNIIKLIKEIEDIDSNQLKLLDAIIIKTDIGTRVDCIEYIKLVLDIYEDYKIKVLNEILLNNPSISKQKFNLVINLIKKFNHSELKFVLNEVLEEVTPDGEKIVVNSKSKTKRK